MSRVEDIISRFELEIDDATTLSEDEELAILNTVYLEICERPLEILKASASGSISTDAEGSYITLPADFQYIYSNYNFSENYLVNDIGLKPRVIFMGTNRIPYKLVNFSDRRQYRDQSGVAYIDMRNNKIRFTVAPTETTYEFDYIILPPTLALADAPLWPARFDRAIFYGMAAHAEVLERSEKARSYRNEHLAEKQMAVESIEHWNAQFINY